MSRNRWRVWLSQRREVGLTTEGKVFVVLTLVLGIIAVNTGLNLLYLMLAMMLSIILVSGFLSEMCLKGIRVHRQPPPEAWAGQPCTITLTIGNEKSWLPSFSLEVEDRLQSPQGEELRYSTYVLYLRARQPRPIAYEMMPPRRGRFAIQETAVRTRFPFGLFAKARCFENKDTLLVYPARVPISRALLIEAAQGSKTARRSRRHTGPGEDFHALHEFRPGDNPRWIHWKSSARQGRLMVKEFERNRGRCVNLLFDPRMAPGDPGQVDCFERAVSTAASVACELDLRGCAVYFATLIDEPRFVAAGIGRDHLRRILSLLSLVADKPEQDCAILYRAFRRRRQLHAQTLVVRAGNRTDRPEALAPCVFLNETGDVRSVNGSADVWADSGQRSA